MRLTRYRYNNVATDAGGHYFYINEGGTVWNPGWQPVQTKLDSYECRVGTGYTVIESAKNGLRAKQTVMVPRGYTAEVTRLELTNETDAPKDVSVFSFVEFCLWNAQDDSTNFQRNYALAEFEYENDGAVLYHKTEYRERRRHYAVYAVNAKVDGFDTDRESFIGLYNGFDKVVFVESFAAIEGGARHGGSHQGRFEFGAKEAVCGGRVVHAVYHPQIDAHVPQSFSIRAEGAPCDRTTHTGHLSRTGLAVADRAHFAVRPHRFFSRRP